MEDTDRDVRKLLPWNLCGKNVKNQKDTTVRCLGRDLNREPPDHKSKELQLQPICPVSCWWLARYFSSPAQKHNFSEQLFLRGKLS